MTLLQGEIIIFGRGRCPGAVLENLRHAIAPHSQRKPRNSENQGRNRYYPSIGEPLNESTRSGGAGLKVAFAVGSFVGGGLVEAGRRGPVRSTPNSATATTPDTAPRSARRGRGARGETIMRASAPWKQPNRYEPDPALALLAGVVIVAIKDAQRGCNEAAAFLADQGIPENVWRKSSARLVRR